MCSSKKYIDQGISVNTSYNPQHYEEEKIPMSEMMKHLIMCYKYGMKQLYYFNTFDGATDDIEEHAHPYAAEGEPLDGEEDCEACVI